jgi:Periplasmic copper-binding protein (NosD)
LIEDTVASDSVATGIIVSGNTNATLNRITANNNQWGVVVGSGNDATIANSIMSNNGDRGLQNGGVVWLAKNVISGNATGVHLFGGTMNSYGDNYIRDNTTPVAGGSLTPVTTQ